MSEWLACLGPKAGCHPCSLGAPSETVHEDPEVALHVLILYRQRASVASGQMWLVVL